LPAEAQPAHSEAGGADPEPLSEEQLPDEGAVLSDLPPPEVVPSNNEEKIENPEPRADLIVQPGLVPPLADLPPVAPPPNRENMEPYRAGEEVEERLLITRRIPHGYIWERNATAARSKGRITKRTRTSTRPFGISPEVWSMATKAQKQKMIEKHGLGTEDFAAMVEANAYEPPRITEAFKKLSAEPTAGSGSNQPASAASSSNATGAGSDANPSAPAAVAKLTNASMDPLIKSMKHPEVIIIEDWLGISKKWFYQICEVEKKALVSEPSVARNDLLFECSQNKELHAKFDRAITKANERLQALRQGIPFAGVASAKPPKNER